MIAKGWFEATFRRENARSANFLGLRRATIGSCDWKVAWVMVIVVPLAPVMISI